MGGYIIGSRIIRGRNYGGSASPASPQSASAPRAEFAIDDDEDSQARTLKEVRERVSETAIQWVKFKTPRKIVLDIALAMPCTKKEPEVRGIDAERLRRFGTVIQRANAGRMKHITFFIVSSGRLRDDSTSPTYIRVRRNASLLELPEQAFRRLYGAAIATQFPTPKTMVHR